MLSYNDVSVFGEGWVIDENFWALFIGEAMESLPKHVEVRGIVAGSSSSLERELTDFKTSDAPIQYGGKFEWRFNPSTNSLDLVVLD